MEPGQDVRAVLEATWDDATVGSLMATFAHSGNNRLTVILSCLDLLASGDIADPDLRAAVDLAQGASQQLASDLAALLEASRRRLGEMHHVEIGQALLAADRLQAAARTDAVPVELALTEEFLVEADPSRLVAAFARVFELGRRRSARLVLVRGEPVEVQGRAPGQPALRKGRYCRLEFVLREAALPAAYASSSGEAGHLLDRLREGDGLEMAALEAFAASLRGRCLTSTDAGDARLDLYLPVAAAATVKP